MNISLCNPSVRFPKAIWLALACLLFLQSVSNLAAAARQEIRGHTRPEAARLTPLSRLDQSKELDLVIGLPLRHRDALTNLLDQLYDRSSTNFHRFLTPDQFTETFAPTPQDYEEVATFFNQNGLPVTGKHPNRTMLKVSAKVSDIERLLHTHLQLYQHPAEARTFFAPDVEPSLDLQAPILAISGLDNYRLPHPKLVHENVASGPKGGTPRSGSGPSGQLMGKDFRAAYAPDTALDGSGQVIGLFELDGYFPSDILLYEVQAGLLPAVPLVNVLVDGASGNPGGGNPTVEVSLDIEMVVSMAPRASQVTVYEGRFFPDLILTEIAHPSQGEPLPMQISDSWGYPTDPYTIQLWQQMDAQGQSYFNASGDKGAYSGGVAQPDDCAYITIVGGTVLGMSGSGTAWASETTWPGSGGGFSTTVPIQLWQQGMDMTANQGSTSMRNLPDVAMVASGIYVLANLGVTNFVGGTSCAAPLWGGFMALANQQAAMNGQPSIGFLNPAVYAIGKGAGYSAAFHDITTGSNTNSVSPTRFFATAGYDLCTGWGAPKGASLINALQDYAGQVWVQFGAPAGDGSFDHPFNLLALGIGAVPPGGTVIIKSSSSIEVPTITKPMTIRAFGGPAIIGRN